MSGEEATVPILLEALEELERHLRAAGSRWSDDLLDVIARVDRSDPEGARRFLRMHGGMGSLNDEWLPAADPEEARRLNLRRDELDERAWLVAKALLREEGAAG